MENILSNVSWWGILAMIYTTLQLTWNVVKTKSTHKISQIVRISGYQFQQFFNTAYKPLTVLSISILMLTILESYDSFSLLLSIEAFWVSVACMSLAIGFGFITQKVKTKNKLTQAIYLFWGLNAPMSIGIVLFTLVGLVFWLALALPQVKDLYQLLHIGLSVVIAFCLTQLTYRVWQHSQAISVSSYQRFFLSEERLDTILGATISASILGMLFSANISQQVGWVVLPVVLAVTFLALSAVLKIILALKLFKLSSLGFNVGRVVLAMVFGMLAYFIVKILLPTEWMLYGHSYTDSQLLYVLWLGLGMSILLDKVLAFYKFIQKKYTHQFINKPTQHQLLTYALRFFITLVCSLAVVFTVIYAYQTVGLYGLALAMVALMSNALAQVSLQVPAQLR